MVDTSMAEQLVICFNSFLDLEGSGSKDGEGKWIE